MERHIGTFKTGEISVTYGQRKWLACELSKKTIRNLEANLRNTLNIGCIPYMSTHLQQKIAQGELTFDNDVIESALDDFEASLVEYNETPVFGGIIEHRVLLRPPSFVRDIYLSSSDTTVPSNLCFVICIDNLKIITAYWNAVDDQHSTLRKSRYTRKKIKRFT